MITPDLTEELKEIQRHIDGSTAVFVACVAHECSSVTVSVSCAGGPSYDFENNPPVAGLWMD
jgi:hypothetical protein